MLRRVKELAQYPWIKAALEKPTKSNIRQMIRDLNIFIQQEPDFARKFGLEDKRYKIKSGEIFLNKIKANLEKKFVIKPVKKIADDLEEGFVREAKAISYIKYVRGDKHKFAAFAGEKQIGFTTGHYFKPSNKIAVMTLYVSAKYRELGIAERLLYRVMATSRRLGYSGISVESMSIKTHVLVGRMKNRWDKKREGFALRIEFGQTETAFFADINFVKLKRKKKKK
ncbi:GNAT family N-acetyltransferase [Nanoarchaeota archaeon]